MWLAAQPPIDWEFLAATRPRPFGRGDKHSLETIEKIRAAYEKRRKRRQRAARLAAYERHRERWRKTRKHDPLLRAMEPGRWYSVWELRRLPHGEDRDYISGAIANGVRYGALEARQGDCRRYYRLTELGEKKARLAAGRVRERLEEVLG